MIRLVNLQQRTPRYTAAGERIGDSNCKQKVAFYSPEEMPHLPLRCGRDYTEGLTAT